MSKFDLKQLAQSGASNSQIIRYNSSSGLWEADTEFTAVPTISDKEQTPGTTSGNYSATGVTLSNTPAGTRYVTVRVNGIAYDLGDGVRNKDCYFSDDGYGNTAKHIANLVSGDELYWNGTIVGFEIGSSDVIDFEYNTSDASAPIVDPGLIFVAKKVLTSAASRVSFTGLNGNTDQVYKLIYRITNNGLATTYTMEPNGSSSNCLSIVSRWNSGGITQVEYASSLVIGSVLAASAETVGEVTFHVSNSAGGASLYRVYTAQYISNTDAGGLYGYMSRGEWQTISGELTSLDITDGGTGGDQIGAGSKITLYKIKQS